jgi:hypothetical protein
MPDNEKVSRNLKRVNSGNEKLQEIQQNISRKDAKSQREDEGF